MHGARQDRLVQGAGRHGALVARLDHELRRWGSGALINFENKKSDALVSDIAASFQEAVTESLFYNTLKAAEEYGVKIISVSGGVSANSRLKEKFEKLKASGYKIYFPKPEYASDNAAMIGLTGYLKYIHSKDKNEFSSDSFNHLAKPRLDYENF